MKFNNAPAYSEEPRENPPPKTYPARLIGAWDIGKQKPFNPEDEAKNQIILVYDLLGKEKMSDGKNFTVFEFLTQSLHVKSTLAKRLKVLGAPIRQQNENWFEITDDAFSVADMLGNPCMIEVGVNSKGNAKVTNVMAPMDGISIAESQADYGWIDLDDPSWETNYSAAPKWIKKRIDERIR